MQDTKGFPSGSVVKNLPAKHETWVWSLGWEDHVEQGMAMHFSILAWNIPWTEELRRLQPMESQRVGHNWSDLARTHAGQEAKVRSGHGTMDWFKIGKGVRQGCILSPAYLTYVQSTSCEMPGWMNHKLKSRLPGEITTSDMQMIPLLTAESKEELKSLLMRVKRRK